MIGTQIALSITLVMLTGTLAWLCFLTMVVRQHTATITTQIKLLNEIIKRLPGADRSEVQRSLDYWIERLGA